MLFTWGINGQAKFTTAEGLAQRDGDLDYLEQSGTRRTISLAGGWSVRFADEPDGAAKQVNVPSSFESESELIFEKILPFTPAGGKNYKLVFLGVSHKAEIMLNGRMIYRHPGGTFPFSFLLPRDLLKASGQNKLSVKVNGNLDKRETFPFKMSFLYPYNNKGIFREVFVQELPDIFVGEYAVNYKVSPNGNRVELSLLAGISNRKFGRSATDSIGNKFDLQVTVRGSGSEDGRAGSADQKFSLEPGKDQELTLALNISDPRLWSPSSPYMYDVEFRLYAGDVLLDEAVIPVGFYFFRPGDNSFNLNNGKFSLKGVTYIPSVSERGSMLSYEEMARDIRLIRSAGFNAVRFEKNIPHPYLLHLCATEGLLAFIEAPIANLPSSFADDPLLSENLLSFSKLYLKGYRNFSAVAGFGFGTGFLGTTSNTVELLKKLSTEVKKISGKLVYASFATFPAQPIEGIDIYGLEFVNRSSEDVVKIYQQAATRLGTGRVMVAGAGYILDPEKSRTGSKHSTEAQAKFFEDLLMFSSTNPGFSFFFSTMFDYRSNYQSIISGAAEGNIVNLGLMPEDRSGGRLSYKVVDALLNGRERVTISLGFDEDDAPIILILFGLGLAFLSALLLNTGKKFKEDALRAMLRPYNFYQDVRDYNQISPFLTTYIALVICAVMALISTSLLFYWRYDILLERIILSFGFEGLLSLVSYLSWNPTESLFILTIAYFGLALLFTLFVRFGAMFVVNRVTFLKSYLIVIWASLPYIIVLPGAILMYRILNSGIANEAVYIILALVFLWNLHRLLKGMHVVYDVPAFKVYFFTTVAVVVVAAAYLFYHQFTHFTVEQIIQIYLESKAG